MVVFRVWDYVTLKLKKDSVLFKIPKGARSQKMLLTQINTNQILEIGSKVFGWGLVSYFFQCVIFKIMYERVITFICIVLCLLLRKKYTEKLLIKELQNVVSPGRLTLEKPQLQVQEVACQSQIKQFQVRTTKLYFMENWHSLKVCATFQGHSTENLTSIS